MPGTLNQKTNNQNPLIEVNTEFLYPGVILKGDAFTGEGEKILDAYHPITQEIMDYLKNGNIKSVYYEKPQMLFKKNSQKSLIPIELLEKAFSVAEEIENSIMKKHQLPKKEIEDTVEQIINKVAMAEMDTILNLLDLKNFDQYTYTHSVNVAVLAVLFAKQLHWEMENLKMLGVGTLLHDMGKLLVPKSILNKNSKLTPEEWKIMQKHTLYGYEILKNQSDYPENIRKIPLMHHENYDGKGYLLGIKGEQISEMASIVSICDTFDAMTSRRSYKVELPFWFTFLFLNKQSGKKFNPRFAASFVNTMPHHITEDDLFPIGLYVVLNTGEICRIIKNTKANLFRPIVNILINAHSETLKYPLSQF